MLLLAAVLLLCGICSALFYAINPLTTSGAAALQTNVICGSMAGFGLLLGGIFAWQGAGAMRGKEARAAARAFPSAIVFALLFVGAVLIGVGVLGFNVLAAYVFPPWHFIAAIAAPLAFVAFAARRLGATSGVRALLGSLVWGALGATTIAIVLEIFIAIILISVAAIFLTLMPGGSAVAEALRAQLRELTTRGALSADFFAAPWVAAAVLFYFGVIVPPIEEAFKTLVVAFCDPKRATAPDMILWGIGAGAGFALLENLFNAGASLENWSAVMIIRVGAAVMHIANGALMGRAWYAARAQGRWTKLVLTYFFAIILHAAWNVAAIGSSARQGLGETVGGALVLIALTGLGLGLIFQIVRSAARDARAA